MSTKIVFLGTGTPAPDPERFGPSLAIIVNQTPYLIDFGPGIVRRVAAAYRAGTKALHFKRLKRVFLTHLHSDHTVGYPDLLLSPWVLGRDEPLEVYGPEGIRAMTEHVLAAYQRDINERIYGLEGANRYGYQANVYEIEPGIVYQDSNVRVEAFPVRHGAWRAFGYEFYTPERTIVVSGDTAPIDTIVDRHDGCDVLIHEVYSVKRFNKLPSDWQRYVSSFHTSSHELAEVALKVKPGLLILYHQLFWGASEEELLSEVRTQYAGNVISAKDLEIC